MYNIMPLKDKCNDKCTAIYRMETGRLLEKEEVYIDL
jgi:hypothetical protein